MKVKTFVPISLFLLLVSPTWSPAKDVDQEWQGWRPFSPREEIRPAFAIHEEGGPDGKGGLVVRHDARDGLYGAWSKTFEVEGDHHYRVTAFAKTRNVATPRANRYVELYFHDLEGNYVHDARIGVRTRPFYPLDEPEDSRGWTKFSDIFQAPTTATHATVRLHLRWEPKGEVEWGGMAFVKSPPRKPRKVRLAAVNFRPKGGKSTLDNCRQLAPFVEKAAAKRADLVVFGECITTMNNGLDHVSGAEAIPGPATKYLASLSDKHDLYLVTSLFEKDGHKVYNTAVMLGPDGELVGTYRKLCLARGEYRKGIAPGSDFPVFDTRFGKVGMMICFDVHMPEVARGIAANGAEVIAMPIMGGHPALAKARAIENQIFLVASTYSLNDDWMQTGVWDLDGELRVRATTQDEVVVQEVDLSKQHFWRANMGDFKGRLRHERPPVDLPK